ncbi:MAG: porin [Xanthomonadaceae bacterium]|nr:porin [Xanthomonadaceae bacterium]
MNKNLISFAVAAVLAGGVSVAQAGNVTVFGNVNVSIDSIDQDSGRGDAIDDINMENNTSAIGVKGSEDLGNGLQAIFLVDFGFNADEGSGTTARDQWVGLAGNFGKVRFGTISTSYKSHGAMVDPIYRTALQGRNNGLQSDGLHNGRGESRGRMNNHVRYDSPSFYGVGVTVDYSFDSDDTVDGNDTYGIGAHYRNKDLGLLAFIDYISSDSGDSVNAVGEDIGDDAWKIGGSFAINDMFGLYAQYEVGSLLNQNNGLFNSTIVSTRNDGAVATDDASQWFIGASAGMGNTLLFLAYGEAEELDGTNGFEQDSITLALNHKLSNRTDVTFGWAQTDVTGTTHTGEEDRISVGLRHKF